MSPRLMFDRSAITRTIAVAPSPPSNNLVATALYDRRVILTATEIAKPPERNQYKDAQYHEI
jgi:hypothetical protein